jgi:hypothetical protein
MTSLTIYTQLETLPSDLKKEAKEFLESIIEKHQVQKKEENKKPVFGSLKGKIWMSDDFDAPLEDFNDYM